ncbi:MAG TPA: hypothetical protein DD490_04040, partial [Acidobacteria bacterium]|nr:hypothetical protein [Acidobacteriota bacterium]
METIWQDIRFGIRTLIRHPATSVVALLTLALGIGANTALFSVVNGVLLRPLPYPESAELVVVQESNPDRGLPIFGVSPPNFEDWQRQNQVFEAIGASTGSRFNLTGGDRPEAVLGAQVTPELFRVAGVAPALGRTFLPEEGRPGGPRVVILSQGLWQRRFGSDPAVLGRQLPMDGESYTIIGVMPAGFEIPRRREVWVPLVMNFPPEMRGAHFFSVYARLKDGVSLEKAAAEMKALAARLEQQYPDSNTGWTTVTRRLQDALVEDV